MRRPGGFGCRAILENTMQNNVIKLSSAVWAELKQACDTEAFHHAAARAQWPVIARCMAQLRDDYPSDNDFGKALIEHGIEFNKNDRAAFVWMGKLKPEALEDAMANCERESPQTFRLIVESWNNPYYEQVSYLRKPAETPNINSEMTETASMEPENADSQESTEDEIEPEHTPAATAPSVPSRSTLSKLPPEAGAAFLKAIESNWKHGAKVVMDVLLSKSSAKEFRLWWCDRLIDGTARQSLANNKKLAAPHIVDGLHKSFLTYCVAVDNGVFSKKEAERLMAEFDDLRQAAAENLTLIEYQRNRNSKNVMARAQAAPPAPPAMADQAMLADGTTLRPQPIVIAGKLFYPLPIHEGVSYEDAMIWTNWARRYATAMYENKKDMAPAARLEWIGRDIATHGSHLFGRQYPNIGRFLSSMGQIIRSAPETMHPTEMFVMEPLSPRAAS